MSWKIILIIVSFCLTVPALSQDKIEEDIEKLSAVFSPEVKNPAVRKPLDFSNEFSLIFSASYHFYKAFISSQDANNCAFYPSCSTYALETIQVNGLLGIFDAVDRLTRCNGFSPKKYPIHNESQHFYDPVKKIH